MSRQQFSLSPNSRRKNIYYVMNVVYFFMCPPPPPTNQGLLKPLLLIQSKQLGPAVLLFHQSLIILFQISLKLIICLVLYLLSQLLEHIHGLFQHGQPVLLLVHRFLGGQVRLTGHGERAFFFGNAVQVNVGEIITSEWLIEIATAPTTRCMA